MDIPSEQEAHVQYSKTLEWKSTATEKRYLTTTTIGGEEITVELLYTTDGIRCPNCSRPMRGYIQLDGWYCPNCGLKMCDCFIQMPNQH
jgi:DNA-directed RNA polymerase subunit RPC12/RpoP